MMLTFTIFYFSFFLSIVHASPLALRDVFNPTIITPNKDTVWMAGSQQTVTWQTSNIPPNLTNPNGIVLLGQLAPGGEHLQINNPLAKDFKLTDGQVQITVPSNATPQNNYIIVLMGDSGNASPTFTITDNTASPASTTTTSSTVPGSSPVSNAGTGGVAAPGTTTATSPVSTPTSPSSMTTSSSLPTTGSSSTSTSSSTTTTSRPNNSAWTSSHIDSMKAISIGMLSLCIVFLA